MTAPRGKNSKNAQAQAQQSALSITKSPWLHNLHANYKEWRNMSRERRAAWKTLGVNRRNWDIFYREKWLLNFHERVL